MDNYPAHLAPAFNEGGGVDTPFEDWWPRVRSSFPNVPEEVAQYWLHEHWAHSPYRWLPSVAYEFDRQCWPSSDLRKVRSNWSNFVDNDECRAHGEHLVESFPYKGGYRTAVYMSEQGAFPTPIIVLDNRDGHVARYIGANAPLPQEFILIEGHRRLNIALYLVASGKFASYCDVWIMRPAD